MIMIRFARRFLSTSSDTVDCVVIGAGVVGLAIARTLAQANREVIVLEQSSTAGTSTSSRNSEVIHAGIYYKTDSLKATLCVEGRKMLYEYCKSNSIPHKQIGKLIVATHSSQLSTLSELMHQGKTNGVEDLEQLDRMDASLLEPGVRCMGACLSPSTGIIDSHQFMQSLQADAEASGAVFSFGSRLISADVSSSKKHLKIRTHDGEQTTLSAFNVINSAGLDAWTVAESMDGYSKTYLPKKHLAKGCYFAMKGHVPFTRLIYPIPEPQALGIHLTLDLQGKAKFGPDLEWIDQVDYTVDPARAKAFYGSIRKYYPALADDSLVPDYAGIRPKNSGPGEPASDFLIQTHQAHVILGLVNLFGIESPGLTASLAIAEYITELLE